MSAEQKARELLIRLGLAPLKVNRMTAGDLVELANLIHDRNAPFYRVHISDCGAPIDTMYWRDEKTALAEAEHQAKIYAAIKQRQVTRHDVGKYGIVAVWRDQIGQNFTIDIRLEQCNFSDAEP